MAIEIRSAPAASGSKNSYRSQSASERCGNELLPSAFLWAL